MTEAPVIFDRALTQRRQLRALAQGPADFLLRAAVEDLLREEVFVLASDVRPASPGESYR